MNFEATFLKRNGCGLCAPLGAVLAFKGIEGAVSLLYGSQTCSTNIRHYLISHFNEPMDILSLNYLEDSDGLGNASNLNATLDNIIRQNSPQLIGIATSCIMEPDNIDMPGLLQEYAQKRLNSIPILYIPPTSYSSSSADGFHFAVLCAVEALTRDLTLAPKTDWGSINLFPGMLSPADLRHLKAILADFGLAATLLPDYSQTMDGVQWDSFQEISPGGTPLESIYSMGHATASLEFGRVLAQGKSPGKWLHERYNVPCYSLGLPIGVHESDLFFQTLEAINGKPMPNEYAEARGRLIDSYVDSHKYVTGVRAAVYGEENLVVGIAAFLSEIGMCPILCASDGKSDYLNVALRQVIPDFDTLNIQTLAGADFYQISEAARALDVELFVGNSKCYPLASEMEIPLVRVGFPIYDRLDGARLMYVGYHGTQRLFDKIVDSLIEYHQANGEDEYTFM